MGEVLAISGQLRSKQDNAELEELRLQYLLDIFCEDSKFVLDIVIDIVKAGF